MNTRIILTVSGIVLLTFLNCVYAAIEPTRPDTSPVLSAKDEAKIKALKPVSGKEGINQLRKTALMVNDDFLNKAIGVMFAGKNSEAVDEAINVLKQPRVQVANNKRVDRTDEFFVAKKVLQVYSDLSMPKIAALYKEGNPTVKCNLLEALGNMEGNAPRDLLLSALDDKTECEEMDNDESVGPPLRICDIAYNQLVLRYMPEGVLRTIGTMHKVEQREYHIEVIKGKI
jgi:hypothetical protein